VKIVRVPRVLLAALSGMGLGMAGTALQGMMRNPLVGPDIICVSSGTAFGGVIALVLGFQPNGIFAAIFCGGQLALACTVILAKLADAGSNSMILILAGEWLTSGF